MPYIILRQCQNADLSLVPLPTASSGHREVVGKPLPFICRTEKEAVKQLFEYNIFDDEEIEFLEEKDEEMDVNGVLMDVHVCTMLDRPFIVHFIVYLEGP